MRVLVATVVAAVLAVILAPTSAAAQPGMAPPAIVETAEPGPIDPSADRAFASPTALTQPEGSVAITGLLIGPITTALVTVGVTDRVHVQGAFVSLIGEDEWLGGAMGKLRLHSAGQLHIGAQAGFWRIGGEDITIFHGGLVGTVCFDLACRSTASVFVGQARSTDDDVTPLLASGSLVLGVTDRFKLVGEFDRGFADGDEGDLVFAGVRIVGRELGLDVGALVVPDEEVLVPTLSLTYRGS